MLSDDDFRSGVLEWNNQRNLLSYGFDKNLEVNMLREEILEYYDANNTDDKVDALCDIVVVAYGAIYKMKGNTKDIHIIEDAKGYQIRNSIDRFMVSENNSMSVLNLLECVDIACSVIENTGYNYKCCLHETLKEISSRKGKIDSYGKFQKFTDEESRKLWYKANYESCRKQ